MKLYPMEKLTENVGSRYLLVNLVAHRARQISTQAERDGISLEEKPVTTALEEAYSGELEQQAETDGE